MPVRRNGPDTGQEFASVQVASHIDTNQLTLRHRSNTQHHTLSSATRNRTVFPRRDIHRIIPHPRQPTTRDGPWINSRRTAAMFPEGKPALAYPQRGRISSCKFYSSLQRIVPAGRLDIGFIPFLRTLYCASLHCRKSILNNLECLNVMPFGFRIFNFESTIFKYSW